MKLTGREWYLYVPRPKYQAQVELDYCRYHVWDREPPSVDYQCTCKAREYIDGFGFCHQHAKMVQEWKEKQKDG